MMAGPSWLYSFVYLAGASAIIAINVAGLVITLRRWHLGMAPRLGAIGFGLVLVSQLGQQAYSILAPVLIPATGTSNTDTLLLRMAVVTSLGVLISGTGYLLVLLALRMALRDYERARNATPTTPDAWPPRDAAP